MNKVGFFYHSDNYNIIAIYACLHQLRQIYPDAPISFWEDPYNEDVYKLQYMMDVFNCTHNKATYVHQNDRYIKYAAWDWDSLLTFADRIYISLTNELSDCEWIMFVDHDSILLKPIEQFPISQYSRPQIAGGDMFTREAFLLAYELLKNVNKDCVHKYEKLYIDHFMGMIFRNANLQYTPWFGRVEMLTMHTPVLRKTSAYVIHGIKWFYKEPYGLVLQNENDPRCIRDVLLREPLVRYIDDPNSISWKFKIPDGL